MILSCIHYHTNDNLWEPGLQYAYIIAIYCIARGFSFLFLSSFDPIHYSDPMSRNLNVSQTINCEKVHYYNYRTCRARQRAPKSVCKHWSSSIQPKMTVNCLMLADQFATNRPRMLRKSRIKKKGHRVFANEFQIRAVQCLLQGRVSEDIRELSPPLFSTTWDC